MPEFLPPGAELNDLGIMAMMGNWDRVDKLLDDATIENNLANVHRDPNEGGCRPLHYAAWDADIDIINKLLDKGADPLARNSDGETPMTWAVKRKFQINIITNLNIGSEFPKIFPTLKH